MITLDVGASAEVMVLDRRLDFTRGLKRSAYLRHARLSGVLVESTCMERMEGMGFF